VNRIFNAGATFTPLIQGSTEEGMHANIKKLIREGYSRNQQNQDLEIALKSIILIKLKFA
jgi:hypothetical protein